jgi:Domain of unknown function (DUF4232)
MAPVPQRFQFTLLLMSAAALVLLTACGPIAPGGTGLGAPGPTSTGAGVTPTTASPPSTEPSAAEPPASTAPPAAGASPSSGQSANAGGTRCPTSWLRVAITPGSNAAGHVGLRVEFTNTAGRPCTMYGYPGVSFLTGPAGSQLNQPAQRAGGPPTIVPLAPNRTAHADLLLTQVDNFPTSTCHPTLAAGVRVYPPDETAAVYVASPQRVCTTSGVGVAQIYPIQA